MVNYDNILYLFQKGKTLYEGSYPIDNNVGEEIYMEIEGLDGNGVTVLDYQEIFRSLLPKGLVFWKRGYCFNDDDYVEDYDEVNYSAVLAPHCVSKSEYNFQIRKKEREAETEWYESHELKKTATLTDDQKKEKDFYVSLAVMEYNLQLKERFSEELFKSRHAINYEVALLNLKEEHPEVLFSHDYKGFSNSIWFKPTRDIEIAPKTNFVFGKSSYFMLVLKYKGIHILPYSEIVKYRFQGTEQQVRHYRAYTPKRSSWNQVMEDTCALFKDIQTYKDSFIERYILNPLDDLMGQLKYINETPDPDLEFTEMELGFNSYCFFDTGHIKSRKDFYKIIRLSNTLFLLENLAELNNSKIANTKAYRETILSYNKELLPSIPSFLKKTASSLKKVKAEIAVLKETGDRFSVTEQIKRLDDIASNLKKMHRYLNERLELLKKSINENEDIEWIV